MLRARRAIPPSVPLYTDRKAASALRCSSVSFLALQPHSALVSAQHAKSKPQITKGAGVGHHANLMVAFQPLVKILKREMRVFSALLCILHLVRSKRMRKGNMRTVQPKVSAPLVTDPAMDATAA